MQTSESEGPSAHELLANWKNNTSLDIYIYIYIYI